MRARCIASRDPTLTACPHHKPRVAVSGLRHRFRADASKAGFASNEGNFRITEGDSAALKEAAGIYEQATDLVADAPSVTDHQLASEPDAVKPPSGPAAGHDQLFGFWIRHGLTLAQAAGVMQECAQQGRHYSAAQLEAKLQKWQRVLPDTDIVQLVAKNSELLEAEFNTAFRCMVVLVKVFPGEDVQSMVCKVPSLLWCTDLAQRLTRVLEKVTQLHPSRDEATAKELLVEHPELLYRMDYYMQASLIDELPLEVQNQMMGADQCLSATYRYYRNRANDYQGAASDDESQMWGE